MTVLKTCSKCKEEKPQTYFPKAKARSDGFYPQCKTCKNSGQQSAYALDPEPAKARAMAYREANLEMVQEKERLRSKRDRAENNETVNERNRRYYWRTKYGLTPEQYYELLERQNGCCGVCGRHHSEFNKIMAVDHDHKTLELRGLLCTHCNLRVIGKHRDPEIFRRAANYLSRGTGWFAPKKKRKPRKPRAPRAPRKAKHEET